MKDKGISRDVGSGARRTRGEDPGLGGFHRASGHLPETTTHSAPSSKGERRRRRVPDDGRYPDGKDDKRTKSAMMIWTMLLGAGGIVVITMALFLWLKSEGDGRKDAAAAGGKAADLVRIDKPVETKKLGDADAVALATEALAARTDAEILQVIDPGPVPAAEVGEFLKVLEDREGSITGYDVMARLDSPREDMAGVVVSSEKDGKKGNRIALFTPDGTGRWKMDFPAFSRMAVPSWGDLLSGKAESAVVRVYVERDQYFNGPFSEADGWTCYGVASPDVDRLLFGYCKKGGDQDRAILSLLDIRKMARVTVVLGRAEGADGRQFVIKRVLAHDWLVGDEPADGAGG
ncbi:hypothetical protein OVA24_18405 [Luteolibacter sp. SL250]|uniref:hypothetical protein n=1 Tax=Luteolibacter sp. SL250 TaxID=2995170 RepID=UPI00226EFD3D|nr:hypothetical protein [Luteolibacter sp. SL250]WAC19202.1 hypothetical protein OVA24_18405 [Luteolibacter sp. SL250]